MGATFKLLERSTHGKLHEVFGSITFGTSDYASGGYPFTPTLFGLGNILSAQVIAANGQASGNVKFLWDTSTVFPTPNPVSTNKLMALRAVGSTPASIVVDEVVTVATNTGRLANVPAYIMAINVTAGGVTGAFTVVPVGSVVATTQCAVNFATGALTFFATDAVTSVSITYIPMGFGPFVAANQVIDELVTLPNATTVNLANQAALVQYIYESTTLLAPLAIIGTQNSPGAGQVQLQLLNSANTTITDNAAQNTKVAKVTYWKKSAFPTGTFGMVDRTSTNATSSVINYGSAMAAGNLQATLINCYGVHHAALATNTDVPSVALGPSGTAAASQPVLNPVTNRITYAVGDNITREFIAYILLNDIFNGWSNELPAGTNLSGVTVYVRVFGSK